jgi:ADP-heptose:LPS heptosyltransferase
MLKPESLKIQPPHPYVFKSSLKCQLMAVVDFVGSLLFSFKRVDVDWKRINKIAVLRLDHLGDVILALPFIETLRVLAPQAQIDFYVGPWSEEVVRLSGLPVNCRVFRASWFDRAEPKDRSRAGVSELTKALSSEGYDIGFDLRGDFRHILAMWKAKIPIRVGQVITGGHFLLTHPAVYDASLHEMEQNLNLLTTAGVATECEKTPHFYPDERALQEARKVKADLGLTKPVIVLHAICAATAKRWSISNWKRLIESLPNDFDLVMVGTDNERPGMEEIVKDSSRKVFLASGLLGLSGLAAFLAEAKLFIGVDSGPAHIAAAMGIPVLSLFSGTNRASQWQPRGDRVVVIQKQTPCSPCALSICPLGNECMELITVDEVLKTANSILS